MAVRHVQPQRWRLLKCIIVMLLVIGLFATLGLVLVLMERKVAARMQIRLGPNLAGPKGILQTDSRYP